MVGAPNQTQAGAALATIVAAFLSVCILISSRAIRLDVPPTDFVIAAVIDAVAHVAVPILFMAVGAATLPSARDARPFYQAAWRWGGIPLIGWTIAILATRVADGSLRGLVPIAGAVAMGADFHFWLGYGLAAAILVTVFLRYAWRACSPAMRIIVAAAALFVAMLDAVLHVRAGVTVGWPHLAARHLPYVFLGAMVVERGRRIKAWAWAALAVVGTVSAAFAVRPVLTAFGSLYAFDHLGPFVVLASSGAFGLLVRFGIERTRPLAWLAVISVHAFFAEVLVADRLGWRTMSTAPRSMLTMIVATYAVSMTIGAAVAGIVWLVSLPTRRALSVSPIRKPLPVVSVSAAMPSPVDQSG